MESLTHSNPFMYRKLSVVLSAHAVLIMMHYIYVVISYAAQMPAEDDKMQQMLVVKHDV